MEQGEEEEEGESPFSQLALAGVIPKTSPVSSQEGERNKEREEGAKAIASNTVLSPETLNSSAAASNDEEAMSIGGSTCNEDTVLYYGHTPTEETQKQTVPNLNSELARGTMTVCFRPEIGRVKSTPSSTSHGGREGKPLVDGEADESGVDNVQVKQEPLEEEETEPQKRYVHTSMSS